MFEYLKKASSRLNSDDGGVTVEFVILFPVLLTLAGAAMDVGFTYFKKSQIHAAIQDVTRARSVGDIANDEAARKILADRLALGFTDEAIVTMEPRGSVLSTSVEVPLHDMQLIGFFAGLVGDPKVVIGDQQYFESFAVAVADDPTDTTSDTVMSDGILDEAVTTVIDQSTGL